jgi:predicted nucleic acid-binding protein
VTSGTVADLLVDTDVFIDHLRLGRGLEPGRDRVAYSTVTRAELFAGRNTDERIVRLLLEPFRELLVDRAVAELAGRVRRQTGMRLPDALIAATALVYRLALVTRNQRDFERVPRLRLRSPA